MSPVPETVPGCLSPELIPVKPVSEKNSRAVKEVLEFPSSEVYVPHNTYRYSPSLSHKHTNTHMWIFRLRFSRNGMFWLLSNNVCQNLKGRTVVDISHSFTLNTNSWENCVRDNVARSHKTNKTSNYALQIKPKIGNLTHLENATWSERWEGMFIDYRKSRIFNLYD